MAKAATKLVSRPTRSNQTAKVSGTKAPTKSDVISAIKPVTSGGNYTVVEAPGQVSLTMKDTVITGAVRKLAVVGGSYKAVKDAYAVAVANPPKAGLAKGLDARSAPHSAKSVADAAGKGNPAKAPAKADKKAAKKAERAEKAAPKGDDTRAIKILKKDFAFGREGSARRASWDACLKSGNVAAYAKAGGALKYLPRWASAGAIKLG